jgi:hypothetical protein
MVPGQFRRRYDDAMPAADEAGGSLCWRRNNVCRRTKHSNRSVEAGSGKRRGGGRSMPEPVHADWDVIKICIPAIASSP